MDYVSQEYQTQLEELATLLVTPERFGELSGKAGQLALLEAND